MVVHNRIFCNKCGMYYKPLTRVSKTEIQYICPICRHGIVIEADEETLKTFWN